MSNLNPFSKQRKVISDLYQNNRENQQRVFELTKINLQLHATSLITKSNIIEIDTTPTYVDMYKFLGLTYTTDESSAIPASAYEERDNGYHWIYPIYNFPVPAGQTPESITGGATPWEYKLTLATVKTTVNFPLMPDWGIDGARLVTYLYRNDGTPVGYLKAILLAQGQNLNEISIEFNYFYRWVKLQTGYRFEFYAIYPLQDSEIKLKANLYISNVRKDYNVQPQKI